MPNKINTEVVDRKSIKIKVVKVNLKILVRENKVSIKLLTVYNNINIYFNLIAMNQNFMND